ncbi:MAG: glutamate mutase L [Anaerolineae bacterium]|jgi:hypothetical protein|nr:glutamate mutase L [Anaerolineae bacterium]
MAEANSRPSSGAVLAADFGSVTTRVLLLDVVDGEYRLVARGSTGTTIGYPANDVGPGLQRVLRDMSSATGRNFFRPDGGLIMPETGDRAGVDYFVVTASAGRPMRVLLVGLMPGISLFSMQQVIRGTYIESAGELHLEDGRDEQGRLNAALLSRPDVIFIAGGTEGGAQAALLTLLKPVALAVQLMDETRRPVVLYAGNSRLFETVRAQFGDLTGLLTAENVRPTMTQTRLDAALRELGRAYDVYKERQGAGFYEIGQMSSTGVQPTAATYRLAADYFARQYGDTLALDVGSSSSLVAAVLAGQSSITVNAGVGVGHSARSLLEQVGEAALAAWLPFYPEPDELLNYALNKTLRPASIPVTLREFYLEYAFVRAGLGWLLEQARPGWTGVPRDAPPPPLALIVAGGAALTATGSPAASLMLIADAVRPAGITAIKADPLGMIPAAGGLATLHPAAAVQLLDSQHLEHLGTVISLSGVPVVDQPAIRLTIKPADGDTIKTEIAGGHVLFLPLPASLSMELDLRVVGGLNIGGKRRVRCTLTGGTAGVLIDARGRPLLTGDDVPTRAQNLVRWWQEATEIVHEIPPEWLEAPPAPALPDMAALTGEEAAAEAPRRGWFGLRRRAPAAPPADEADALDDLLADLDSPAEADPAAPRRGLTGKLTTPAADDLDALRRG